MQAMTHDQMACSLVSLGTTRPYDPTRPLVFMHVPKSSGTSLIGALLETNRTRSVFSSSDPALFGDFDITQLPKPSPTEFVAEHMSFSTLLRGFPGGQLLTLLREPVSRLLSLWLYRRSFTDEQLQHWGRWGDRVRNGRLSLAEFLRATFHTLLELQVQTKNLLFGQAFFTDIAKDENRADRPAVRVANSGTSVCDGIFGAGAMKQKVVAGKLGSHAYALRNDIEDGRGYRLP